MILIVSVHFEYPLSNFDTPKNFNNMSETYYLKLPLHKNQK